MMNIINKHRLIYVLNYDILYQQKQWEPRPSACVGKIDYKIIIKLIIIQVLVSAHTHKSFFFFLR